MPTSTWPFVGRDHEVAHLLDLLEHGGAHVTGDAGVGKSRLLAELHDRATADGWSVTRVQAIERAVPLAPFAALLPETATGDVLDRVLAVTGVLASAPRAVVLVDDAPLLDEVSVVLVHHLVTTTDVRVVVATRRGERLADSITALLRDRDVAVVDLQPLGEAELADLVGEAVGALDAGTRHRLWEQTRGNPLFAREVVLDALQRGELVETGGGWRLGRSSPGRRVHDVVAARLGALDDDERVAVELLALGEPLGLGLLEPLVGADVLERLERRGVIAAVRSDRREELCLAHPIYAEVVRLGTGAAATRARRRRLVDALVATGARRADDALRLAILRCDLGEVDDVVAIVEAADALERAHQRALAGGVLGVPVAVADGCLEAAVRLGRMAHDNGGGTAAVEVLVKALARLGRMDEVRDLLLDLDRVVVDAADVVRAARLRAYGEISIGGLDRALDLLAEALTAAGEHERAALLSARIDIRILSGRVGDAAADGDELLATGPLPPRAAAPYGFALARTGRGEDALAQVDPLLADTAALDPDTLVLAAYARIAALVGLGRVDDASQLTALLVAVADRADDVTIRATARLASASVDLMAGRVSSASAASDAAADLLARADPNGFRRAVLTVAAFARTLAGDVVAGAELDRAANVEPARQLAFEHLLARGNAWLLAGEGHRSRAVVALVALAATLRESGAVGDELDALHDLVRLGEPAAVVGRLDELAVFVQGPLAALAADHARAAHEVDGAALDEVAARAAALGMLPVAADAAAQAEHAHLAAGLVSTAAASRRASRAWLARCEGLTTPATRDAASGVALTRREREAAELAARGLADKEIATALGVSARTVESHLASAYSKLGAAGRRDLASLLAGEPVV
jgi:DNA-binding CsgD family transcriptional regulator